MDAVVAFGVGLLEAAELGDAEALAVGLGENVAELSGLTNMTLRSSPVSAKGDINPGRRKKINRAIITKIIMSPVTPKIIRFLFGFRLVCTSSIFVVIIHQTARFNG